jgi:type VI protein secretion system component VasA
MKLSCNFSCENYISWLITDLDIALQFHDEGGPGAKLLLYSAVLSRGLSKYGIVDNFFLLLYLIQLHKQARIISISIHVQLFLL